MLAFEMFFRQCCTYFSFNDLVSASQIYFSEVIQCSAFTLHYFFRNSTFLVLFLATFCIFSCFCFLLLHEFLPSRFVLVLASVLTSLFEVLLQSFSFRVSRNFVNMINIPFCVSTCESPGVHSTECFHLLQGLKS